MLVRWKLADHFWCWSTSAVGTNQKPVSPEVVAVAGRTSSDAVDAPEDGWGRGVCGVCAKTQVGITRAVLSKLTLKSRLMRSTQRDERKAHIPPLPCGSCAGETPAHPVRLTPGCR